MIRYPGSDASRGNALYLYADRLGSVMMEAKNDGSVTAINTLTITACRGQAAA